MNRDVCVVGYGLVGAALASRLSSTGRNVSVVDPRPDLAARTAGTSHRPIATIDDHGCDVVVISTFDAAQAIEAVAMSGSTTSWFVVVTTMGPEQMAQLGELVEDLGGRPIEFPISGTSSAIASGDAFALVGADQPIDDDLAATLSVLTPRWRCVGAIGTASAAKLAINLVLEISRTAVAEGLALGRHLGLDQRQLVELLQQSAAASRVIDAKAHKMIDRDFVAEGRVEQSLKDCELMLELAAGSVLSLPMLNAQRHLLQGMVERGAGHLDGSAVIDAVSGHPTTRQHGTSLPT